MATVRFHSICDDCGKHSEEYQAYGWCRECGDDVCRECCSEYDDESGYALCKQCAAPHQLTQSRQDGEA